MAAGDEKLKTDLELLQYEVEGIIRDCEPEGISEIAKFLKIEDGEFLGKSKSRKLRDIGAIFDSVEEGDQKLTMFTNLTSLVSEQIANRLTFLLNGTKSDDTATPEHIVSMPTTTFSPSSVKTSTPPNVSSLPNVSLPYVTHVSSSVHPIYTTTATTPINTDAIAFLNHLQGSSGVGSNIFRKDFKIQGLIGDPEVIDVKKRLDYISLCCQLAEGRTKGYSDEELAITIRHACVPGSYLRKYLDGKGIVPISDILESIRSVYEEKSASQLYGYLYSLVQQPNETSAAFVLRALSVKQQVLITSKVESGVKYTDEQVHYQCMHALNTGFSSRAVLNHMNQFIQPGVCTPDSILLSEIRKVASLEGERAAKQPFHATPPSQKVKVNEVKIAGMEELIKQMSHMTNKVQSLEEEVRRMKSDKCGIMKNGTDKGENTDSNRKRVSWKRSGCDECTKNNVYCSHCWKCGAEGHRSRECQNFKKNNQSSN